MKIYYYYDSEEGVLFTTTFRNCKDGSIVEELTDKIYPYEAGWRWIDVSEVFNPVLRSFGKFKHFHQIIRR